MVETLLLHHKINTIKNAFNLKKKSIGLSEEFNNDNTNTIIIFFLYYYIEYRPLYT